MKLKTVKLQAAADCIVDDLNMLQDGAWVPDAASCQASIDNAVLVASFMDEALTLLQEAIEVIENEYPKSDARYVLVDWYKNLCARLDGGETT